VASIPRARPIQCSLLGVLFDRLVYFPERPSDSIGSEKVVCFLEWVILGMIQNSEGVISVTLLISSPISPTVRRTHHVQDLGPLPLDSSPLLWDLGRQDPHSDLEGHRRRTQRRLMYRSTVRDRRDN